MKNDQNILQRRQVRMMSGRIIALIIIGLTIAMNVSPFMSPISQAYSTLRVGWTQDPKPGWYGETVAFYGYASGGTPPYYWDWNFGGTHFYTQNTSYTWYPTSSPTNYSVTLSVHDSTTPSPKPGQNTSSVEIKIAYDLTGQAGASPVLASKGSNITITITAHNNLGYHICPAGYTIRVEIYRLSGQFMKALNNITGPSDLSPGEDSVELHDYYYAPFLGVFYAKVYFDTTYDQDPGDNVITSNLFTIA